ALPPDVASLPGDDRPVIPGYDVRELLGQGGMGAVWKGLDLVLDRTVALKVIRDECVGANLLARFMVEARAAAAIQHPNGLPVDEAGPWQPSGGGRELPYIAMEYVEGGMTLRQRTGGQSVDPKEAARLVYLLALAVEAAHARGTLHRDLKPAN